MYSCLKFGIEISMLEEKSLMVLIVLGNTIKKSTFKSEVFSSLKSCFISKGNKSKNKKTTFSLHSCLFCHIPMLFLSVIYGVTLGQFLQS